MCTRVVWPDAAGSVLVGRNMDYHRDTGTNLWSLPRGIDRRDGVGGSLTWTSKFGSVVAAAFDMMTVDGMNEAGLSGHILWLAESDYGTYDPSRPALSMAVWMQYFLDNFATVAEAAAWIEQTEVQVVPLGDPATGEVPTVHLALDDATGDSAIVEYVDGKATVWHDRSYQVMTNSPTYDKQLELLREVEGFGGDKPLPGTTDAADRFARAAYYVGRLPEPESGVEAVAGMFSVIRNAAQPFRVPDPDKPYASQTIWQTVGDLTGKRYVFASTTRPNVLWVDLSELDFTEGAPARKLDLLGDTALEGGLGGNVTDRFVDTAPFTFLELPAAQ
ncbi:linear amide C-N hydrolase [Rhodococcus sp. HM1]|uniref:linear amide C-N hydrolase n=1 Tax=unclassified Rhodococcus (in: high G+C Gram-positive bacteria) TaxID=192944 RepID=UPI0018CD2B7D|nr:MULTISPECIES: linear amide C-N hydrolase [unclassified Rhodococcus (in: high G+C Gram-positive bacteria)]MBH0118930.1 linear amide C-N hydrolase [Rhodococcus sp. CX]MCK8674152.1 linear amide C-N hydrolase [Rhodococcus sp. HM1]